MFFTDPNQVEVVEFQYFTGTKHKVAALNKARQPLPVDHIVSPEFPGAGHVVLQQGDMVVHRAKALAAAGERVALVNGYVPKSWATHTTPV